MFLAFQVPGYRFIAALARAGHWARYWGPTVPIILGLLVAAWWFASTRAGVFHSRRSDWLLGWLPWVRGMLRWSRTATFLEILALLIESHTPLSEAVTLAAEASGDPQTLRAARQLAAALRQGRTQPAGGEPAFPPLVDWLMLAASREGALLPALQHSAAAYHRRARHQADLIRVFLPVCLTIVVGGTVTVLFALSLFLPYANLLRTMSLYVGR